MCSPLALPAVCGVASGFSRRGFGLQPEGCEASEPERPGGRLRRVASFTRPPSAVLLGLIATLSPAAAIAQQPPSGGDLPVSLERIRAGVEKPIEHAIDIPPLVPLTRFRTSVEERRYMLPFKEQLDKDLEPTLLQAQSRDWASRCCGIDLGVLFKGIDQALQRRKERKIREQIARELDELKAAAVVK
jgi:hypothetical protein